MIKSAACAVGAHRPRPGTDDGLAEGLLCILVIGDVALTADWIMRLIFKLPERNSAADAANYGNTGGLEGERMTRQ